ncbi:peptidoglycan DD-metalloendopeptidase family protein [Candidatus Azambacteria bacterium]|nr:peptidoglycan DD-metalloendopeptidase family protein [Candidatus Azambacteria bacterium]
MLALGNLSPGLLGVSPAGSLGGSENEGLVEEGAILNGFPEASLNLAWVGFDDAGGGVFPQAPGEYIVELSTVEGDAVLGVSGPLTIQAQEARRGILHYTVEDGDSPALIAARFGITTNTVLWANTLRDGDLIQPGQDLLILPVSGVKHETKKGDTVEALAKRYRGEAPVILAFNDLKEGEELVEGIVLIIPDGELPAPPKPKIVPRVASQYANLPAATGYFIYPTTGRNWGRIHGSNGVDVANACGTPIYAAAAGLVSVADPQGWNGGLGKYLKISHPNGTETLYAHSSRLLTQAGAYVGQGEVIALMGTTGRSTGCHLHFEVHGARNPLVR